MMTSKDAQWNIKNNIVHTSEGREMNYLQIELAIYTYNDAIIHSTTGEIPYNI